MSGWKSGTKRRMTQLPRLRLTCPRRRQQKRSDISLPADGLESPCEIGLQPEVNLCNACGTLRATGAHVAGSSCRNMRRLGYRGLHRDRASSAGPAGASRAPRSGPIVFLGSSLQAVATSSKSFFVCPNARMIAELEFTPKFAIAHEPASAAADALFKPAFQSRVDHCVLRQIFFRQQTWASKPRVDGFP